MGNKDYFSYGDDVRKMKDNLKVIGAEAIYLLISIAVAGIAALIQIIGRTYEGDYSSFIFSGRNYRYNGLFYAIGLLLFLSFMIAGYWFFLQKRISGIGQAGAGLRVAFFIVAFIFALVTLAVLVLCYFLVTGLNDNMKPEVLFLITWFGWPVFSLVFMVVVEVRNCKKM